MKKTTKLVIDAAIVLIGLGMIVAFLGKAEAPVVSGIAFILIGLRNLLK